jgi:hypothetical protein
MVHPAHLILAVALAAVPAAADVTLLAQQRTVEALTTFDNQMQTASAVAFEPFQVTVAAETTFPTPDGGTGTNEAVSSINCLVDPNAIRASGSLAAAGGFAVIGTEPSPVFGEAAALVIVQFRVDVPTHYRLTALPRPSDQPGDEFELELSNLDTDVELFELTEDDPAQSVDVTGTLQPARYDVQFQVELTGEAALTDVQYGFNLSLFSPCGVADVGASGGELGSDSHLDNNDFIAFINLFFNQAAAADVGTAGGIAGSDGQLDNNDFIAFITEFFNASASCY